MVTIPRNEFHRHPEEPAPAEVVRPPGGDSVAAQAVARLRILWRQRRLLFRLTLAGFAVFTILALLIPRRYQSSAELMPPDDQTSSGFGMMASLASKMTGSFGGLAGGLLGLKSSGDLFIGILGSRAVQDALVAKFDLRRRYRQRTWQAARRELALNTTILEDRKSGIISISVTDRDPERAAAMGQEYIAQLNAVVSQLTTSSARRERIFLEGRLAEVRKDLESAEKNFSQFASQNATVDIKEQGRAMVVAAATLEGQLIAAESELQGLKQIYSDNNVRVRALAARISELQSQQAQMGGKQETAGEEASSRGDLEPYPYPSLRQLPLLGVPYADLYRQSRVQEVVFETLTQEYEMAKVAEAKEIPSVRVLDAFEVPERKSYPPVTAIIGLGTFATFLCSTLAVLARAHWEQVEADDPQKAFVREVVHTIRFGMPWAAANGSRFQALTHRWWLWLVPLSRNTECGAQDQDHEPRAGERPANGAHSASPFDPQL
jgi:uncharacterized protein involved in exopolysaccharide biosynthesis